MKVKLWQAYLATLGIAAGTTAAASHIYTSSQPHAIVRPNSLEGIVKHEPPKKYEVIPTNQLRDGWYIQYSFNSDTANYDKNKQFLEDNGYRNVQIVNEKTGARTLIGRFSTERDAVQQADDLEEIARKADLEQVGIIEARNGKAYWKEIVKFQTPNPDKPKKIPKGMFALLEEEVNLYNTVFKNQVSLDSMQKLMHRENPKCDPNAKSYKVRRVPNRNPKTNKTRPYILVYKTDNRGNKIPSGAYGLTMVTKAAMKEVGLDPSRIFDPRMNLRAGIRYFGKWLKKFGNETQALIAYNGGPSRAKNPFNKLPMETREYVIAASGNYHR